MADTQVLQVQTSARGAVPGDAVDLASRRVRALLRLAPEPVLFARVKLTMVADPAVRRPAIAQANIDLNGRLIRAQAVGESLGQAIERMTDRLRIQLERAARNWAAVSNGRAVSLAHAWLHQGTPAADHSGRAQERSIIRHKSYSGTAQTPEDAIGDLELLDYDFYLFKDQATGEDSVVYRAHAGYGLARAHPRPGTLDPSVAVRTHRAPRLSPDEAAARMEHLGQRFVFFIDRESGRGCLVYHRYDGNYGLIVPADTG